MVDLAEIQAAYYMVAATGVLIAAVFYILNLQTQRKNTQTSLETRQLQLLLDYGESKEAAFREIRLHTEMMEAQWTDFPDYLKKYGLWNNPEQYRYRETKFHTWHVNGLMVRDGLIDIGTFVDYNSDPVVMAWEKYKEIIYELRRRFHLPSYLSGFEYLAGETDRYRVRMGWGAKTPDDFSDFSAEDWRTIRKRVNNSVEKVGE